MKRLSRLLVSLLLSVALIAGVWFALPHAARFLEERFAGVILGEDTSAPAADRPQSTPAPTTTEPPAELSAPAGQPLARPSAAEARPGMGYYYYTDASCTIPYTGDTVPEGVTLYGRYENESGADLYGFDPARPIGSREELALLFDYVYYYNIKEPLTLSVTYTDMDGMEQELTQLDGLRSFRGNGATSISYGVRSDAPSGEQCYISIALEQSGGRSAQDDEATITAPATDPLQEIYTDLGYHLRSGARPADFDAFYIDGIEHTVPVTTTNQLLYAVEHGYRPLPEAGSSAARIYAAAREVLRDIVAEDDSDIGRVEAIYCYLVQNVAYDYMALAENRSDGYDWSRYDAYFMEGVFDHGKAVCDGIAKSFVLLCRIEGIPAVELGGTSNGRGHAWCAVRVGQCWYIADPTAGRLNLSGTACSVADRSLFLISELQMQASGCLSADYPAITARATAAYGYYEKKTATVGVLHESVSFVIDGRDSLVRLLRYCAAQQADLAGCSIDFLYNSDRSFSELYNAAVTAARTYGVHLPSSYQTVGSGARGEVMRLIFGG